jgi:hypothetical protein
MTEAPPAIRSRNCKSQAQKSYSSRETFYPNRKDKKRGAEFLRSIHKLTVQICNNEAIPEERQVSIMCQIHKKSAIMKCFNYIEVLAQKVISKHLIQ